MLQFCWHSLTGLRNLFECFIMPRVLCWVLDLGKHELGPGGVLVVRSDPGQEPHPNLTKHPIQGPRARERNRAAPREWNPSDPTPWPAQECSSWLWRKETWIWEIFPPHSSILQVWESGFSLTVLSCMNVQLRVWSLRKPLGRRTKNVCEWKKIENLRWSSQMFLSRQQYIFKKTPNPVSCLQYFKGSCVTPDMKLYQTLDITLLVFEIGHLVFTRSWSLKHYLFFITNI